MNCCIDNYTEIQELPSGKGYADIVYIPRKNSQYPAMIVELKWNKTVQGAIDQIKEKNYPSKMLFCCIVFLLKSRHL
jgi:hypothetical protein